MSTNFLSAQVYLCFKRGQLDKLAYILTSITSHAMHGSISLFSKLSDQNLITIKHQNKLLF